MITSTNCSHLTCDCCALRALQDSSGMLVLGIRVAELTCDRSARFASPLARHFHWWQGHSRSPTDEEAHWSATGLGCNLLAGARTCVAPSAAAWQEKVGVRLQCLTRGAWPKGWLPPCPWGKGCQLPNTVALPSPWLVLIFLCNLRNLEVFIREAHSRDLGISHGNTLRGWFSSRSCIFKTVDGCIRCTSAAQA